MKRTLITFILLLFTIGLFSQVIYKRDLTLQKTAPTIHLYGLGAIINFNSGDVTLTQSANTLTMAGGNLALGTNSLYLTGSVGSNASRALKGWFTDLEVTNAIAGSITGNAGTVTGITLGGGTLTFSGADAVTIITTGVTSVALPASGTLVNTTMLTDSIALLRESNMIEFNTVGPIWADTLSGGKIATKNDLENIEGGGGGTTAKNYLLQFRTDTTSGAPETGDSIFTDTQLIGQHILVYRGPAAHATNSGGLIQLRNATGVVNVADGYRFNSTTGQIIFRPVFVTNELVTIVYSNTILWETVSITGEESSILDNLIAYYDCDETSGTTLTDSHGDYDGTVNGGTVGSTGKLGYSVGYDGALDNTTIDYNVALVPSDSMAVSLWFYMDDNCATLGHSSYLFRQMHGADPWETTRLVLFDYEGDTYLYGGFKDADGDGFTVQYANPITVDTWYHVVLVNRGDGNYVELWLNGVRVDEEASFDGTIYPATGDISIGNSYESGDEGLKGLIDEVSIHNGLTPSEIVDLYNSGTGKTYPLE